jgi:Mrp family chromosome partitioning ATPase
VPRSIGITSQLAGEGVSFTSRALAVVLARAGETCLLESNWWNPVVRVGPENPGLAGLLQGRGTLPEVIIPTNHSGLSIVPAGDLTESGQAVMANTAAMRTILDSLHTRFEFVVVDLPAILTSATALSFAAATEASILVVRQRVTRVDQVESAIRDLRHTNLLGVVFNANKVAMPGFLQRRLVQP